MRMLFKKLAITFFVFFIGIFSTLTGQELYQFISPLPGSDYNTMESTIIIREGALINPATVTKDAVSITGSKRGKIEGEVKLSTDGKTIIFEPFRKFLPGEKVMVQIYDKAETIEGKKLEQYHFSFNVAPFKETPNPYEKIEELKPNFSDSKNIKTDRLSKVTGDFPPINVDMYDSNALGEGKIFMAVAADVEGIGYYLMVLNNDGSPYWSKELKDDYAYDFKVQPNGYMTYAQFLEHHSYTGGGNVIHMVMDQSFNVIDSVQMKNGYIAEAHDFQILPNGHYLLFGYYLTEVDMSQYVDGGYPNALVSGGIVQELDADKNVVFQWRSWDYYDFDTYDFGSRAARPVVSQFHLNTINLDDDGNMFLATPRWCKKINRQTGDVIWSLGDVDNDFSFFGLDTEEGIDLANGHTFHRLENGNILVYDNGDRQGNSTSRVNEMKLDEESKTAELVWSYVPDSLISGWHRGSAQRLQNGNTVIGWGGSSGKYSPAFTEVNSDGEVLMELFFDPYDIESYRAFRLPVPPVQPASEVVEIEIAPGNTYEFIDEENGNTGVSIKVNSMQGSGYNELQVDKYNYSPLNPAFPGKPPRVIPGRAIVSESGLTAINYDILFDTGIWDIENPEEAVIYHREFPNSGLFVPLATSFNHVTGKVTATSSKLGEFVVTHPDFEAMVFVPQPRTPENENEKVNYSRPVQMEWSPVGYVNNFDLEIATDAQFDNIVVSESNMNAAIYEFTSVENNTEYFWHVKAYNDAGESEWSEPYSFTTSDPFINVESPGGGESIQIGLNYFIKFDDNIEEEVIVELLKNDTVIAVLDTAESRTAYEWEVGLDLALDNDYKIKLTSVENENLFDISDGPFSISDSTTSVELTDEIPVKYELMQNYPNPFNPATTITYSIPKAGEVKLVIYDLLGNEISAVINQYQNSGVYSAKFNAENLSSGVYFYKLSIDGRRIATKKMLLMK